MISFILGQTNEPNLCQIWSHLTIKTYNAKWTILKPADEAQHFMGYLFMTLSTWYHNNVEENSIIGFKLRDTIKTVLENWQKIVFLPQFLHVFNNFLKLLLQFLSNSKQW